MTEKQVSTPAIEWRAWDGDRLYAYVDGTEIASIRCSSVVERWLVEPQLQVNLSKKNFEYLNDAKAHVEVAFRSWFREHSEEGWKFWRENCTSDD